MFGALKTIRRHGGRSMASIRPLITITILVVVGAYLYVKINEGPVQPRAGAGGASNQPPDGVPPLAATKNASLASEGSPAAWPPAPVAITPSQTTVAASTNAASASVPATGSATGASGGMKQSVPSVPTIPDLPPLPAAPDINATAAPPVATLPKDLPANIPTARYPDDANKNSGVPAAQPLTTTNLDSSKTNAPGAAAQTTTTLPKPGAPSTTNPGTVAMSGLVQQPAAAGVGSTPAGSAVQTAQNPLRPLTQSPTTPTDPLDRYGSATIPPITPMPASASLASANAGPGPVPSNNELSFAASWPVIQAALNRRDLKQAHQLLSKWHGSESLTPSDSERVETLLSQLAGTVIYSTEHQLEPARIVKQGETLEAIAKEYNVPWELLAKINGVQSPNVLLPGQQLKVVRGPFSAVVNINRNEMALMLGDRYAGKFAAGSQAGQEPPAGDWVVQQKLHYESRNGAAVARGVHALLLQDAKSTTALPIVIGTEPATQVVRTGTTGAPTDTSRTPPQYFVKVSQSDVDEIADILSVGSHVTIRR
jgi:LysM repeat protein